MSGKQILSLDDQFSHFIIGVELRGLDVILSPLETRVGVQEFVVFFKDFAKTREIQVLVVLKQNKTQIKLGKRQFQIMQFTANCPVNVQPIVVLVYYLTIKKAKEFVVLLFT